MLGRLAVWASRYFPGMASLDKWNRRLRGLLRLLRPLNFVLFFAGVALGALLAGGPEAFGGATGVPVWLAMVSAALVGGAANAINDVYDLAIDRVNRPRRPLPSGQVSVVAARVLWGALSAIGVGLGFLVSLAHGLIALGAVALLRGYSAWLKRLPLAGNLVVACVLALAILYGGLAANPGAMGAAWLGAAFAFLTTLAREGAKDIEDAPGDAAEGARTLAVVWGGEQTARVVLGVIALTLAVLPLPALLGSEGAFLALVLPAAGCLLAAAWALLSARVPEPSAAGRASAWLKAAMVAGVIALALTRLG